MSSCRTASSISWKAAWSDTRHLAFAEGIIAKYQRLQARFLAPNVGFGKP
jgi:hypothetical protein